MELEPLRAISGLFLTASLQKWAERNPHEWLNFLSFHMFSLLYCWCQLISEPWMPASWRILRSGLSSIALPTSLRSFWLTWRVYPALSQASVHWKNVQPRHIRYIRWESSFSQGPTHLCQDSPGKKRKVNNNCSNDFLRCRKMCCRHYPVLLDVIENYWSRLWQKQQGKQSEKQSSYFHKTLSRL